MINFVMPCFLHFWNQTEIVCVFWELCVRTIPGSVQEMILGGTFNALVELMWCLVKDWTWSCRSFPTMMALGLSAILGIFLLLNERGLFPTGCCGCLFQVRHLPLLHLQNSARTEGWVCFISFSVQVIQLPTCIIKIVCFVFQFCKAPGDLVGKYFKGAKHNFLEGWEGGKWHREAE